jgi:hypothetical protein
VVARELERGEGGVALVQVVVERWPDAERGERAHAADAEERVLHEPVLAVADVELRGDEPVDGRVRGHVGVEQVQRDPANLRPPDARLDVSIADGHLHRERVPRGVARRLEGELLGRDRRPVLVLQPRGIEPLVEVAATVQEAHGDERRAAIRGLLEEVACEDTEAARVDGQRGVHGVLGAQECYGRVGARGRRRRRGRGVDRLEREDEPPELGDERTSLRRALERLARRLAQETHRVVAARIPAVGIHRAPEGLASGLPAPPVVEGEARERPERLGQPGGEHILRGLEERVGHAGLRPPPRGGGGATSLRRTGRAAQRRRGRNRSDASGPKDDDVEAAAGAPSAPTPGRQAQPSSALRRSTICAGVRSG